jgi:hypothetical protein
MAVFTVIQHDELSGTSSDWEKTSIPSSYDHLYLVVSARSDNATVRTDIIARANGDTGSNYSRTQLYSTTATPGADQTTGSSSLWDFLPCPAANAVSPAFSTGSVWIPHYANTANFKQFLTVGAMENNSDTNSEWKINVGAQLWSSTAAINQLTLYLQHGDFVQYSTFTLYGVTGV